MGHPGNGVFAALCMTLLCAGLFGLLMLNTAMAEGSFTLHNLQATSGELADTQDALTQAIDAQRSPANLASRATKLGMVPADSAAFLRLSDGKVLGVAQPAKRERAFTVVTAAAATTAKAATSERSAPSTRVTKKGEVTTTTVVVTKPDGAVQTTVTSVNARTRTTTSTTTTSTTTTRAPVTKPVATPTPTTRR